MKLHLVVLFELLHLVHWSLSQDPRVLLSIALLLVAALQLTWFLQLVFAFEILLNH